jgi:hypothetical protein
VRLRVQLRIRYLADEDPSTDKKKLSRYLNSGPDEYEVSRAAYNRYMKDLLAIPYEGIFKPILRGRFESDPSYTGHKARTGPAPADMG